MGLSTTGQTKGSQGGFTTTTPESLPVSYKAEDGADGSVVVRNVPIFAEAERGGFKHDESWLRQAVEHDRKLRATNYKAPMHFGHHQVAMQRERAGHYELTDVRRCLYQGKGTWVIFGDLHFKSRESFDQAMREYPYRSVEISPDHPEQVNSLALLNTEAPYFRFPNLENMTYSALAEGFNGFAWKDRLFMADDADKKGPPAAGGPPAPKAAPGTAPAGPPGDAPDAEPKKDDEMDFAAMCKKLDFLAEMFQKQFGAPAQPAGLPGAPAAPVAPPPAAGGVAGQPIPSGQPIVAASAALPGVDVLVAKFEGVVTGLQAKIQKLETDKANEDLFAALSAELAPHGVPNLGNEIRSRLPKGEAVVRAWADGIKQGAPVTRGTRGDEAPLGLQTSEPDEVKEYAKFGAEKHAEARRLGAMYAAAGPRAIIRSRDLKTFLASQITLNASEK